MSVEIRRTFRGLEIEGRYYPVIDPEQLIISRATNQYGDILSDINVANTFILHVLGGDNQVVIPYTFRTDNVQKWAFRIIDRITNEPIKSTQVSINIYYHTFADLLM